MVDPNTGIWGHFAHMLAAFLVLGTAEALRQDNFEIEAAGPVMLYRDADRRPGDWGAWASTGMAVVGIGGMMLLLSLPELLAMGSWTSPTAWWFADATSMRHTWIMATLLWPLNDVCETVVFCLWRERSRRRAERHMWVVCRPAWIVSLVTRLWGLLWWTSIWMLAALVDWGVEIYARGDAAVGVA
ncbi:hypothetical protein JDV02_001537 [Purpureocillium takamizusanense]|uniref:Uncharacterized protein n=1 Tax=Purpureocillium takamizusanense TaxID=2060973 RepID=A0A9Q8V7X7_9HYPO|nr:uncharacterized protein JDV02_001537 [Purpureocillium takamizusanense]UNI14961.1 hypothetical protein JDV02_001537 [Purpureocillium takamizusanense]